MKVTQILLKIKKAAEKFGLFVASILNFIFLLPVYFIGVGVTSLFVKITGKDILSLKKIAGNSYWKEYNLKTQKKEDYERMF